MTEFITVGKAMYDFRIMVRFYIANENFRAQTSLYAVMLTRPATSRPRPRTNITGYMPWVHRTFRHRTRKMLLKNKLIRFLLGSIHDVAYNRSETVEINR
jgi:hypothetical protein